MHSNTDKISSSRIESITLHNKRLTRGRRVPAIPQLKCIGGTARGHYEVESMRCRAQGQGYDSNDIQWTCTADTGPYFKLGSTQVLCEGYDHPDDPYILKGSCGVEYRLMLTEEGEARYPARKDKVDVTFSTSPTSAGVVFAIMFVVCAVVIFYNMFKSWQENRQPSHQTRPNASRNDDGNDDDDDDNNHDYHDYDMPKDPPPSYLETADDTAGSSSGTRSNPLARGLVYGAGVAAGAGAATAAATVYSRRAQAQQAHDRSAEEGSSTSSTSTRQRMRQDDNRSRDNYSRHGDGTRTSSSWNNHSITSQSSESTGFGGTTRR